MLFDKKLRLEKILVVEDGCGVFFGLHTFLLHSNEVKKRRKKKNCDVLGCCTLMKVHGRKCVLRSSYMSNIMVILVGGLFTFLQERIS